jgi:hypothetical protein
MRSVLASLPPGSRFLEDGENVRLRFAVCFSLSIRNVRLPPQIQLPENMPRIEYGNVAFSSKVCLSHDATELEAASHMFALSSMVSSSSSIISSNSSLFMAAIIR